jgi:hypothetical protein
MEMKMNDIIDILNSMCERCLIKGMFSTLVEAKTLCDTFDRFRDRNYKNDEEYSRDIVYFYNLAVKLHESGNLSLEESYTTYGAILAADRIDFVDVNEKVLEEDKPVKIKYNKKRKENDGVVDISDIVIS